MKLITHPHSLDPKELAVQLEADLVRGLTTSTARQRRAIYGENRLHQQRPKPILLIFLQQFLDPVIYILIIATVVAFIFGEWMEGIAVVFVILITVLIGFFMEWQAMRSMESLRTLSQTMTKVWRDGKLLNLQDHFLVPGDLIQLEVGDVIPADARIVSHESLAVKESALTGESAQIEKSVSLVPQDTLVSDQKNMAFKGTIITRGTAIALVCYTGDDTEIGKVSKLSQTAEKGRTPLEKKLARLSRRLIGMTIGMASIIAIVGFLQGKSIVLMVETGIALAIAAIPEGLPIVATIALARGMLKLASKQVIIKKLEAVETLGETGIICTDKTGTLTENKMELNTIVLSEGELSAFSTDIQKLLERHPALDALIKIGVLCNNVNSEHIGDPEEIALLNFARRAGYDISTIRNDYREILELPFDTESKLMATLNQRGEEYRISVKGAVENILDQSTFQVSGKKIVPLKDKNFWIGAAEQIAAQGLRTMAFAFRKPHKRPLKDELIRDLVFIGIVGFLDPARKDIKDAIETYRNAGIRVVMVTGDHPQTARKIAQDVGLLNVNDSQEKIVHGKDLVTADQLTPQQEKRLMDATIFARVTPTQKLELVSLYQKNNFTVGMTGDGINDAPALKKADIGIAMGIRGTEAAKEVADVILKDDRFTSIELAIRQGRTIFNNIRQFVVYLMSCNLAEIISVGLASLSNLPLPLLPLQILFLNLVTDVFPALALGMGEGHAGIMKKPPRSPDEPVLTGQHWKNIFLYGLSISGAVIGILIYSHFFLQLDMKSVNNLAFYTLLLAQLLNVFNIPQYKFSFINNEVTRNPWIWGAIFLSLLIVFVAFLIPFTKEALSLVTLTWGQMGLVVLFSASSVLIVQCAKYFKNLL